MAEQEVKIIVPGSQIYGYRCSKCDWKCIKIGKPLKKAEMCCESCGADLVETTEGKAAKTKANKKRAQKPPTKNACKNCVFSRRKSFDLPTGELPGFKCSRDGRTHSPDSCCASHKRRGIIKQTK